MSERLHTIHALGDVLRPEAADTIANLHQAASPGAGHRRQPPGRPHIAAQVGITQVHAEVHPDHKPSLIRDLQQTRRRAAMVGDGAEAG